MVEIKTYYVRVPLLLVSCFEDFFRENKLIHSFERGELISDKNNVLCYPYIIKSEAGAIDPKLEVQEE